MHKRTKTPLDTLYEVEEHSDKHESCRKNIIQTSVGIERQKTAYLKHRDNINILQAEQEIETAKEEWELVSSTIPASKPSQTVTSLISSDEVLTYFHQKDMDHFMRYIKPVKQRKQIVEFMRWLIGPPKLHPLLVLDRDLIFAIAQCPFDTTENIHTRVLQTIYKSLTGSQWDCPRYGHHWEDIGFQGVDPGTDLRGVGFLGLYHLLFFTTNPQTSDLSKEIAALAQSELQDFPFCLMGINITRIVLETLREEVLNKECNRRKDIFSVINEFYAGIYLYLFKVWKEQKKTILDSGYVLKDLSNLAKLKPNVVFQALTDYNKEKAKAHMQTKTHCSFSDIGGITLKPSAEML